MPKKSLIDVDSDDLMTTYIPSRSSLSRREGVRGVVRRWRKLVRAEEQRKKDATEAGGGKFRP